MARGNRDSAVRGNRSVLDLGDRARIEREAERTFRDGVKILRLVFRGVAAVVHYHEGDETDEAYDALRLEAQSLAEAAGRLGLGERATAESVLGPIEEEVVLMYGASTAVRLGHALRQCFDNPSPRGSR